MTYSELESLEGYVGNFTVKIRKKAKYVDWDKCVGCGDCAEKCPSKVASEFDAGLSKRKAIYRDFPQAVPNKFVIDAEHCIKLTKDKCGLCEKLCPTKAIKYSDKDEIIEEKIGAVIVATGFDLFPLKKVGEYGYRHNPLLSFSSEMPKEKIAIHRKNTKNVQTSDRCSLT